MLLTAVHIDDNEAITKNYKLVELQQECYQSMIVPL